MTTSPRTVDLPSLIFDLQEPGDGAGWCVGAVTQSDRAAFAEALRTLGEHAPTGLKGAVRTLTLQISDTDETFTNPTRLSLRPATATALAEALARGDEELRVDGVAAFEVLSGEYEIGRPFPEA